jgi:1,4-dihydroxy-2-naphthoyl-CoA hydrolase
MALVPHCETPYRQRSALLLATKIAGDGYTMKRKNAGRKARRDSSPVMNSGMPRALGVRLISLRKRKVVAEMRVKPLHINRSGRVNGGALMAFADVMGAAGTVYNLPPGHRTGTLESKTNFFRAGEGPVLRAISIPLHIGRTTMVWQTTIRNSDRSVVAIVTQTQIVLPAKSAE